MERENDMNWKKELEQLLRSECTDSDIEDFCSEHPTIRCSEIWQYVWKYNAPAQCKGCKHIQKSQSLWPCSCCSRINKLKDFYQNENA